MAAGILNAYVVCATPRSGSTLLCEMLRSTGCAGRPLEHFEVLRHSSLPRQPREYFSDLGSGPTLRQLAPLQPGSPSSEAPEQWWARIVKRGRTDNGVWGGKLMWGHVPDLLSRARELPGLAGADLQAVLAELLEDPRMVLVTRADKVAQAVSLWRALQTQRWRGNTSEQEQEPVYEFAGSDHLVRQLCEHEEAWHAWFSRVELTPIEVSYEQLDANPRGSVARVLDQLGLGGLDVPAPPLARQRDQLSNAWAERYRDERGIAA